MRRQLLLFAALACAVALPADARAAAPVWTSQDTLFQDSGRGLGIGDDYPVAIDLRGSAKPQAAELSCLPDEEGVSTGFVLPFTLSGLDGAWYLVADVGRGSAYSMGVPVSPVTRDPAKAPTCQTAVALGAERQVLRSADGVHWTILGPAPQFSEFDAEPILTADGRALRYGSPRLGWYRWAEGSWQGVNPGTAGGLVGGRLGWLP